MVQISKDEFELLVKEGILKCVKGRYEGLVVTSKRKKGNGKQRQVEEPIYEKLMKLKKKQKVDRVK